MPPPGSTPLISGRKAFSILVGPPGPTTASASLGFLLSSALLDARGGPDSCISVTDPSVPLFFWLQTFAGLLGLSPSTPSHRRTSRHPWCRHLRRQSQHSPDDLRPQRFRRTIRLRLFSSASALARASLANFLQDPHPNSFSVRPFRHSFCCRLAFQRPCRRHRQLFHGLAVCLGRASQHSWRPLLRGAESLALGFGLARFLSASPRPTNSAG